MAQSAVRPLAGLATILAIVAVVAVSIGLFGGSFTKTVPVTVISDRAGLVMNPEAKVKMRGVQVGTVEGITERPDGKAELTLAMDPSQLSKIPANVLVDIASTTVFGAKFVQLMPPDQPVGKLQAGAQLDAESVTVEINTVFEQLVSVLDNIEPDKLNQTLGAFAQAFNGRGDRFGQALVDLEAYLATIEPGLPALTRDIELAPEVLRTYSDAAPDLISTLKNTNRVSQSIVEEQQNLDAFLISAIGLADIGNDVLGSNTDALAEVARLLVPTLELTDEYHPALTCSLQGLDVLGHSPSLPVPGLPISASFTLGTERYRYPANLPKVAATGGPHCVGLPDVGVNPVVPYLITDTGTNIAQYGNPGILLNSDGLKQLLYGPVEGPPRNSAQIGQPG